MFLNFISISLDKFYKKIENVIVLAGIFCLTIDCKPDAFLLVASHVGDVTCVDCRVLPHGGGDQQRVGRSHVVPAGKEESNADSRKEFNEVFL